jgi:hypothetical protein
MSTSTNIYLRCLMAICFSASVMPGFAQHSANYDESKVGTYTLPSPLITSNNKPVQTASDWNKHRRKEVLQLFKDNMYGQVPGPLSTIHFVMQHIDSNAVEGLAISKQVRIYFTKGDKGPYIDLLLYLPAHATKPVPVLTSLNFEGNHNISRDEHIILSQNYLDFLQFKKQKVVTTRGGQETRWPVKALIEHGYGLATAYYGDLEQDHAEGWQTGIRTTLASQFHLKPADWSAIGAWAWGLSRMLDYLQSDKDIDAKRVIVMGHSRLGKTALWAGANDTRFAAVISNNSGEGGAALSHRNYGENISIITTAFPHWFLAKYKNYIDNVNALPMDQHMLIALAAPRPVYVASATNDKWADPYGEFLGAKNAEPVYALFGKKGLGTDKMPAPDTSIGNTIRYHIRTGDHDMLLFDWMQYVKFADDLLK